MCQPFNVFSRPGRLNFIGSRLMPILFFACAQDEVHTLALPPVLSYSNSIRIATQPKGDKHEGNNARRCWGKA